MTASADTEMAPAIDEDLQSRQMAVYGKESMLKLSGARVLIHGMNGLGAEIAKNVILANVKAVTLVDTKPVTIPDLGAHFYLEERDVNSQNGENGGYCASNGAIAGKSRAHACVARLQELNPSCAVTAADAMDENLVGGHTVVVCVDMSEQDALAWNEFCRGRGIAFIRTDIRGLAGGLFVDLGDRFICQDTTGETLKTGIIESIKVEDGKVKVFCVREAEFDFDDGDLVKFDEVQGLTGLTQHKIANVSKGRKFFEVPDVSVSGAWTKGGLLNEVKQEKELNFKPLKDILVNPGLMIDIDQSKVSAKAAAFDDSVLGYLGKDEWALKFGRSGLLHLGFRAVDAYAAKNGGKRPGFADDAAAAEVLALAHEINNEASDDLKVEELDDRADLIKTLARGTDAVLCPLAAIFGGIAGQEVIKACTGKFHPTFQTFYMDAFECLPKEPLPASEVLEEVPSRYAHQIGVFGKSVQQQLAEQNIFLVGSGALGCEFMKNFAMMGIAMGKAGGKITITDDDIIEKSNLSRQFLFRNHDVGKSKSQVATEAAQRMNPGIAVNCLQERVQPTSENIFNDDFWQSLNCVVNALDNVKARLYVDGRCLFYAKPLLESGTLGPKCNVQVVSPHKTENYGASKDPDEKEAPQCAIHNFPHNMDHCLGLARSEFVGLFETTPDDTNNFLEKGVKDQVKNMQVAQENETTIVDKLVGDLRINCGMSGGALDALSNFGAPTFQDCVHWARLKFDSYFINRIKQLTFNFPEDYSTSTGKPFWSAPKRYPNPVNFDASDPMHMKFLIAASNLRARMLGIDSNHRDANEFVKILAALPAIPVFTPFSDSSIDSGEKKEGEEAAPAPPKRTNEVSLDDAMSKVGTVVSTLPNKAARLHVEEFEKDDDLNFHMDFIASFANIRGRNYAIGEIEQFAAKIKAGRIIPAIATATATSTGFVALEFLKTLNKDRPVEDFRNLFANLALPLFAQSEPMPPGKVVSRTWMDKPDPLNHPDYEEEMEEIAYPEGHTAWDKIEVQHTPGMTLQQFMDEFKNKHNGIVMYGMSVGKTALYHECMPGTKKNLDKPLLELFEEKGEYKPDPKRRMLCVDGCNFQDKMGTDVITPQIVLNL